MIETPETNVKMAALKLMRHKVLIQISKNQYPMLSIDDVNEVLTVAGLPVVVPDEVKAKEVDIIQPEEVTS